MVLNNSQYNEIMREYNAKQMNTVHELDTRTAEVYMAVPQYKILSDKISGLSVDAAKAALRGENSLPDLNKSIAQIQSEMAALLVKAGFPKDYLSPHYTCSKCKDTGYIGNEKCSCFIQASINLLYRESNITRFSSNETFDNFSLKYYSPELTDPSTGLSSRDNAESVLAKCKEFVQHFPSEDNILFYGDTGVGKTFLSNCIARALLDNAHSVLYMSAIELFDSFSAYNYNNEEDNGIQSQIEECELLIIDDLGTELSNSFTNSKLFHCINSRLLGGRSTIISTNLSLNELMDAYSERIFSRISSSYKLLKLYGDDIRFIKK